jgi:hypothetical protein
MQRIIIAGIAGGIAMFVMMSIAHMSPISQIGISQMANDRPALAALENATGNRTGLYIFPSVDMKAKDAMARMDAAVKVEPFGIMAYQPPGSASGISAGKLIAEFLVELVQALIAAALLSVTVLAAYWSRVGFVTLVGLVSAVTTNLSYWNWYAFPASYTLANMAIEIAGFFAAGLAIAALLKPMKAAAPKPRDVSATPAEGHA